MTEHDERLKPSDSECDRCQTQSAVDNDTLRATIEGLQEDRRLSADISKEREHQFEMLEAERGTLKAEVSELRAAWECATDEPSPEAATLCPKRMPKGMMHALSKQPIGRMNPGTLLCWLMAEHEQNAKLTRVWDAAVEYVRWFLDTRTLLKPENNARDTLVRLVQAADTAIADEGEGAEE